MSKYVCIIAGDTSGDVYAGDLIAQLATNRSDIKFQGIAGDSAQSQGMQLWVHNKHLNFMGFTEVLLHHRLIISTWRTITQNIEKNKPDLLILIDYPGLNMRVAKWAKQRGIPIFYYIPPQVWAWGRARIKKLRQYTDYIAPLYPFEQDFLIKAKLNTTLVKHPLLNKILAQQLNHPCTEKPIEIVCMPGSREQEVRKHLENMLTAVYILQVKLQKKIKVSVIQAPSQSPLKSICNAWQDKLNIQIIANINKQHTLATAHLACVVSGTASLEVALTAVPLLLIYQTSWLNYRLAKWLLASRIRWIGLPNLIAQSTIIPELIQEKAKPDCMAKTMFKILKDNVYREGMHRGLLRMRNKLDTAAEHSIEDLITQAL